MFLLYLLGCQISIQFDFLSVLIFFFVFKLLLSFFWLCEEAECIYPRLHLGRKSCLVCFLDSIADRHVFITILLLIVLILFFLYKSL